MRQILEYLVLSLLLALPMIGCADRDVLSPSERDWLDAHSGEITIASDPAYPPIDFLNESGKPAGIAADYVSSLEDSLHFRFRRIRLETWDEILESSKKGEVMVLSAARETQKRQDFLNFTTPYLEIPNAIIVREELKGDLNLSQLSDLKVAVVEGYAPFDEITADEKANTISVVDPVRGLEAVSFSKADAIILNLATASYYIEEQGLSNLRVAGKAGSPNLISMACSRDEKVLASILQKGLDAMGQQEHDRIYSKWIKLDPAGHSFSMHQIKAIALSLGLVALLLLAVLIWNMLLRKKVRDRTMELQRDLELLEKKDFQLMQAQKMELMGTLAGGLAHDFNNVLVGILGSLSSMRYRLQKTGEISPEQAMKYVDIMEMSGNRASEVVQRLLALSRQQSFSFEKIDLNHSVERTLQICGTTLDSSIDLKFNKYPEPAMSNADGALVEQVLLNLCLNGSQAMIEMREAGEPLGGTLTITIDRLVTDERFRVSHPNALETEYWSISVADTGVGMDRETVSRIFDPFFTTKRTGTGLGLAMVFNIAERHGGFIDVFSEPEVGTTFNLNIPTLPPEERPPTDIPPEADPVGEGLILVVEDEDAVAEIACAMLEDSGYETLRASNGLQGVELFTENRERVRAVLLDMVMPLKSGLKTCLELRAMDDKVPIIITSGFRQDERVDRAMKRGADAFIQKPYTFERLIRKVHGVIEGQNDRDVLQS